MSAPLAERLRPKTIDDYIGQEHLVGKNGVFRKFFETGNVPSFILCKRLMQSRRQSGISGTDAF